MHGTHFDRARLYDALLVGLVRAGLAGVSAERVRDGDNVSAVARLQITEEGRATLSVPH